MDNDLGATVTAVKPVDLLDWAVWAEADISRWGVRAVMTTVVADDETVDDGVGTGTESEAPAGTVWTKVITEATSGV